MVLNWLKKKIAESPNTVVTGPGVLKTHNVECRFRDGERRIGKLGQDRWSDGQERFSLNLRYLPQGSDPVRLYREGELVSQFEREGRTLAFRWKGMSGEDIPRFEIGQSLSIETGGMTASGVVEAD